MFGFHLQSLLTDEQVSDAPILILGNKIDRPGAISEDEIRTIFGLHGQTTGKVGVAFHSGRICFRMATSVSTTSHQGTVQRKDLQRRPVEVFMCSVLKRQGYGEGV